MLINKCSFIWEGQSCKVRITLLGYAQRLLVVRPVVVHGSPGIKWYSIYRNWPHDVTLKFYSSIIEQLLTYFQFPLKNNNFDFNRQRHLEISLANRWPFCSGLNMLITKLSFIITIEHKINLIHPCALMNYVIYFREHDQTLHRDQNDV